LQLCEFSINKKEGIYMIFIDPGHGGAESGAVANGLIEKDINLVVSLEVKRILELNGQKVLMSRKDDSTVWLKERWNIANNANADFFISIHHNANNCDTFGTEIYHSINMGIGQDLAHKIAVEFSNSGWATRTLQRESATKGQDYYAVIRQTKMPALIIEAGYIDSSEYKKFDTQEELFEEARIIATGILKFIGVGTIKIKDYSKERFMDIDRHWAEKTILEAVDLGIVNGYDDKKQFKPDNFCTRAEVTQIALNLYNLIRKIEG